MMDDSHPYGWRLSIKSDVCGKISTARDKSAAAIEARRQGLGQMLAWLQGFSGSRAWLIPMHALFQSLPAGSVIERRPSKY